LTHTEVEHLALPSDFVLGDAEVAAVVASAPDVVFVCSPNNPTGNAQPLSAIVAMAKALPNALVIVDEAYGEFAPAASAQALIATNPNIAITRTFSKAFALAGARIGYLLAAPGVVADLHRVRLPYHLSALTQTAGIVALRHRDEASTLLGAIRVQRDRISRELRTLPRVTVYPSDANFVLFVPPVDALAVWQGLLDRGVLVRDLSAVVPNALRVTAGAEHETDRFLTAIKEVLAA
jgi:histidinol-phosphate aminotransferase